MPRSDAGRDDRSPGVLAAIDRLLFTSRLFSVSGLFIVSSRFD
tara:strand:+ start:757 stop:885 length:129 start_codon:yes stop_codon:yes gene_type:complete